MAEITMIREEGVPEPANVAKAVYDFVVRFPEQHDQRIWEDEKTGCGTVACIAGWVGILHDDTLSSAIDAKKVEALYEHGSARPKGFIRLQWDWEARQARRLGIESVAAGLLFNGVGDKVAREMLKGIEEWHKQKHPLRTHLMHYDELDAIRYAAVKKVGGLTR